MVDYWTQRRPWRRRALKMEIASALLCKLPGAFDCWRCLKLSCGFQETCGDNSSESTVDTPHETLNAISTWRAIAKNHVSWQAYMLKQEKWGHHCYYLILVYSTCLQVSLPSNFTRTKKHSAIVSWVYSSKSWTTKNGYPEFENRPKHPQPFVVFGTSHRSCLKYVYGIRDDHTNQTWYIIHHHTNSTNVNISPKADRLDRRREASQGWPLRNLLLHSAVMAW